VERGGADQAVAVEGAQVPAGGGLVRQRLPPLVTLGRADRPEGPFGQVEMGVQVVVGADGPDQDR